MISNSFKILTKISISFNAPMKKQIYIAFTVENGIILSSEVLSYIQLKVTSQEALMSLLNAFKSQFNTPSISKDQIDSILSYKTEEKNFYNLKSFKFQQRDLCKELEVFRNRFPIKTVPISLINENECVIFGILYKNKKGTFSLEDDYDTIEISAISAESETFIFDGMFIGIRGSLNPRKASDENNSEYENYKSENTGECGIEHTVIKSAGNSTVIKSENLFHVKEFILVNTEISKKQNRFLEDLKPKICVFNLDHRIADLLELEQPDLAVIFTKSNFDITPLRKFCKNFVLCPICNDPDFLPHSNFNSSNPLLLETFDNLICFISVDLFKNRQNGLFFNKNPMESFMKSIISQNSLYPFGNCDFTVPEFPNIFVIRQDFHPVIMEIESKNDNQVKIISLPSKSDGSYAVLDYLRNVFEIKLM